MLATSLSYISWSPHSTSGTLTHSVYSCHSPLCHRCYTDTKQMYEWDIITRTGHQISGKIIGSVVSVYLGLWRNKIICLHFRLLVGRDGVGSSNPYLWRTRVRLYYIDHSVTAGNVRSKVHGIGVCEVLPQYSYISISMSEILAVLQRGFCNQSNHFIICKLQCILVG